MVAIECDLGGGAPLSWGATGTDAQMAWLRAAAAPYGVPVNEGGGGADIGPLKKHGTLVVGLRPDDSKYFDIHHTRADTLDKISATDLAEATAALAALTWALANSSD